MTFAQAMALHSGSTVFYAGRTRRVLSMKLGYIHGPHFQLEGVADGPTSYRLLAPTPESGISAGSEDAEPS